MFSNRHIEWPFNNWLYDNGMLHINLKAAFVKWFLKVGEYGVYAGFGKRTTPMTRKVSDDFIKEEKDLEGNKWLMDLDDEGIQVSMTDRYSITIDGIKPRYSNMKFDHSTLIKSASKFYLLTCGNA